MLGSIFEIAYKAKNSNKEARKITTKIYTNNASKKPYQNIDNYTKEAQKKSIKKYSKTMNHHH